MLRRTSLAVCVCAVIPLAACQQLQTIQDWNNQDALMANKIEMKVTATGEITETEYHVDPDEVPEDVLDAMKALYPGGTVTGAEKERMGGTLYYEVVMEVDGRTVEAMFLPDGTLYMQEVETDAQKVPQPVKDAISNRFGTIKVTSWERLSDAQGKIVAYHAKFAQGSRNLKVAVSPVGDIEEILRETPAEIEVPMGR